MRNKFLELGKKSLNWIQQEIKLCTPSMILTLGEEVAKVVDDSRKKAPDLLTNEIRHPEKLFSTPTVFLPHPDACRRNKEWKESLDNQLVTINEFLTKKSTVR